MPFPPITNDPESYAKYLFVSWQNANQQEAAKVASADAVNSDVLAGLLGADSLHVRDVRPRGGLGVLHVDRGNGAKITMTVRNLTGGLPIQVVARLAELRTRKVRRQVSPSVLASVGSEPCAPHQVELKVRRRHSSEHARVTAANLA